jgi:hypothetical protein
LELLKSMSSNDLVEILGIDNHIESIIIHSVNIVHTVTDTDDNLTGI